VASSSTLTKVLEKPDVTLEEVLDDADILQECKSNNQKLIDFLQQPGVIPRLLDYASGNVKMLDSRGSEAEEKVGFK